MQNGYQEQLKETFMMILQTSGRGSSLTNWWEADKCGGWLWGKPTQHALLSLLLVGGPGLAFVGLPPSTPSTVSQLWSWRGPETTTSLSASSIPLASMMAAGLYADLGKSSLISS